jgi:hypothetical protein
MSEKFVFIDNCNVFNLYLTASVYWECIRVEILKMGDLLCE